MKKISTAAALLAAGALLFGSLIVACSPHGTGIIDEGTKTTAGTISANAVSGTTATLTDSTGGTYTFISGVSASIVPVLSTASTPAGGTWTYKEKNISFNKYEGTFTGDIAKIGKEATSFKLTVKKVANAKGELMTAKKEASFDFNLTTSAFTATIPEVEASATKAEEEPEVIADPKTVVNAKFDFLVPTATSGIDLNTETDLTEYAKPASDVVTAAKGASLKFITGNGSKVKYENNTNYGLYVGSKKDSLSTVAAAGSYKEYYSNKDWIYGKLELETTDSAKITLNVSGNGDTHYGRWVVVTNVKGKIVGFAENLGRVENGTTEIKELKVNDGNLVNKGKYTIWMHGSRINSITVKNDLTADKIDIPVESVNLTADKTTLKIGATTSTTVTATVNPSNVNVAYDIDYTSSNTDLLTVTKDTTDKNKATVAIKEGATVTDATEVTITATVKGTTISNTCKITVNKGSSVKLAAISFFKDVTETKENEKISMTGIIDADISNSIEITDISYTLGKIKVGNTQLQLPEDSDTKKYPSPKKDYTVADSSISGAYFQTKDIALTYQQATVDNSNKATWVVFSENDELISLSFKVTAKENIVLENISAKVAQAAGSAAKTVVYIDNVKVGEGETKKDSIISELGLSNTLSANAEATIKIAIIATGDFKTTQSNATTTTTKNFNLKAIFGDIILNIAKQ